MVFVLLSLVVVVNVLAYRHAAAMLTFRRGAARDPAPPSLWGKLGVLVNGVALPRPENGPAPAELHAPETVHFAAADGPALEAWLARRPDERGTVLLFHGYGGSRSSLAREAEAFGRMGFATLLVDFRGAGGSEGNTTTLGYLEADDVAAAFAFAESRELPRPHVVYGRSMGGAAVLRAVGVLGVRADGVILESVFAHMLGAVRNRFRLLGVPAWPGAELLLFWGGVRVGFSGFAHDPAEYAKRCACPALVLHGRADRHALLAEGEAIHANLRGEKTWVAFDDAGHGPLRAADAETWDAAVGRFLDGVAGR